MAENQLFDVAVIGCGAMGSATLSHLAKRGLSVVGLEQFTRGHNKGSTHGHTRKFRIAYSEHPDYVPLLQESARQWK
jgi:sarcosine oxidase